MRADRVTIYRDLHFYYHAEVTEYVRQVSQHRQVRTLITTHAHQFPIPIP
jgi:hypothetical protein